MQISEAAVCAIPLSLVNLFRSDRLAVDSNQKLEFSRILSSESCQTYVRETNFVELQHTLLKSIVVFLGVEYAERKQQRQTKLAYLANVPKSLLNQFVGTHKIK